MIEQKTIVGPFQCNCRLFACPKTGEAILVDPGDEAVRILDQLSRTKTPAGLPIRVKYLLQTHGHLDHIGATRAIFEALKGDAPKIALHRGDEPLYMQLKMQGRLFGFNYEEPLPINHYLEDGEEIQIGGIKLSILHTPGHSPGSICIRLHEDSEAGVKESLLSGDTLFQGSVGRTDLWGADQETMLTSIRERILVLDGDTRVCPGHGSDTTIGIEKMTNPFLKF